MKKALVMLFLLVLLTSLSFSVYAEEIKNLDKAEKLHNYGILQGNDQGFQLEKSLTRVEGSVMLVRLLGKEQEVKEKSFSHSFIDVPSWANNYVGYLYTNGLAKGTSPTTFGASDAMTATQYTTFLLRVLGYDDSKGDFAWNTALDKGVEIGLINNEQKSELEKRKVFLRDDMVGLSYDALNTSIKSTKTSLLEKLVTAGVIKKDEQEGQVVQKEPTIEEKISQVKEVSSSGIYVVPDWWYLNSEDSKYTVTSYLLRNELSDEVKNFSKVSFMPFEINLTSIEILKIYLINEEEFFKINEKTNYVNLMYNPNGKYSTVYRTQKMVIFFCDDNNDLLGFRVIPPEEYSQHQDLSSFLYDLEVIFETSFPSGTRLDYINDFRVIRKVNGAVDPSYEYRGGFSKEISYKDGMRGVKFKYYFHDDDSVEYVVESLNPDIKIESVKKVPVEY